MVESIRREVRLAFLSMIECCCGLCLGGVVCDGLFCSILVRSRFLLVDKNDVAQVFKCVYDSRSNVS